MVGPDTANVTELGAGKSPYTFDRLEYLPYRLFPSDAEINQQRLDNLQSKLTELLQEPVPAPRQQEVALMAEIIQRISREAEVTPEQLALAALRLAQGDQPLLVIPQAPQSSPRGRIETRGDRGSDRGGGESRQCADV